MSDERTIKPNAPADFTPQLGDYKTLQPFRYWCQKVLPLVYDDSLSYYELLCKVVDYLNKTMEDVETLHGDVTNLHTSYEQLQNYVNVYFSSLDVQQEINNKLNEMASDGSLTGLISPLLPNIIDDWLSAHITPTTPALDNTFTLENAAAQSKAVGDKLPRYKGILTGDFKNAQEGTYAVDNTVVTGLPTGMSARYGWLVCYNVNTLYMLIESGGTEIIWIFDGATWKQITDETFSLHYVPADSKAVGEKLPRYKGVLTGDFKNAQEGTYAVDNTVVTGLPTGMSARYGWLVCYNVNTLYMLIESGGTEIIWIFDGATWKQITDETFSLHYVPADSKAVGEKLPRYKGVLTGEFTTAQEGTYSVDNQTVTGLPTGMTSRYGWLTCYSINALYVLVESTANPPCWIYENKQWKKLNTLLQNKKIAFIGDSITEWNATANYNYVTYLQTISHVTVQNLGLSGSGFARLHDTNKNYINRLNSVNSNTELLCVSGSFNDLSSGLPLGTENDTELTSICGYMNQFFNKIDELYPTMKVCCYTLNYWNFSSGLSSAIEYINALKNICSKRAIPFINVSEKCNIRPWVAGNSNAYIHNNDNTHPNAKGHALIYPIIRSFIESLEM